ncbi:MAG: TIGR02302 family protein [Rhodospirillales bacterium]|nr:TIGR02302 family protein [Rhodospirillales bacterium]
MIGRGARYRLALWLARGAVFWESLRPRLWPAGAVAFVFLSLAFLDFLPDLPPLLHAAVLAVFLAAFLSALFLGLRRVRFPSRLSARSRVERDSGFEHRPLATIEDDLASGRGDTMAEALWQTHRERAARHAEALQVAAPAAGLARIDPRGFRAAVALLFVIALTAGFDDPRQRLVRAVQPQFGDGASVPLSIEVWLTPPAYTRAAPVFLERSEEPPPARPVPAGTALMAQVSGVADAPVLGTGASETAFEALGNGGEIRTFRLETVIESGDRLTIKSNEQTLAEWPIEVVPDMPPEIAISTPPQAGESAQLRFGVTASDDYGLADIDASIIRAVRSAESGETLEFAIPLPSRAPKKMKARQMRDLTSHLWAGHEVAMILTAKDVAGQSRQTEPAVFVLPERQFRHPVARAIISERKKLIDPTDAVRAEVSAGLGLIGLASARYREDTIIMLGLSMARARLRHDMTDDGIGAVSELLWKLALRLEDGGLSIAERELRRAEERLMDALREGAEDAEIDRLLSELERSLREFLSELSDELARMGALDTPIDPDSEFLDSSDLQQMIDEIRELAQTGSLDAARQRLAQLQQLLQDLRAGMRPGQSNPAQNAEAREMMNALQDLAKRQQDLLDQTFRRLREGAQQGGRQPQGGQQQGQRGQPGQQGEQGQSGMGEEADLQEALRRALGDLMLRADELLGQIPQQLGEAERAMRRATEALRSGDGEAAIEAETQALDALRSGGQQAAQQMARQLGTMPGFLRGDRPMLPLGERQNRDPFGRRSDGASGFASDDDVDVPDANQLRQAGEIIDELRRRAGERERPRLELDYIERLLKRF